MNRHTFINHRPAIKGKIYINAKWYLTQGNSFAFDTWTKDEIRFIGYRKTVGTKTKIGWIKLKVFNNITLFSYKMPVEADFLIIDSF